MLQPQFRALSLKFNKRYEKVTAADSNDYCRLYLSAAQEHC